MTFRYDIQGLRAVAVILVLLFHLNFEYLHGGFIGVDIFFVISGYLISKLLLIKKENNDFRFIDFYISRFKRILPVFLVILIIILIIGTYIFLYTDLSSLRKNVLFAAIFNSNNYLAQLDNYFGTSSTENPLLHTWTLSIEMQFYFLLPIFLFFIKQKHLFWLLILLIFILIGFSYYRITSLNEKDVAYFSLLSRIPEFLIGTTFIVKEKVINKLSTKLQNVLSILFLVAILFSAVYYSEKSNFPGIMVLLPCISVGFLLCFKNSFINTHILSNKTLVHLGELSYSIYLWHWPIMAFLRYYNNEYTFNWSTILFIIVLTYCLSYISYKYIEVPFRKKNNAKFFRSMGYLVATLIILLIFTPTVKKLFSRDLNPIYYQPTFGLKSHAKTFENVEEFGDTQKPESSILLLGDSHALAYKAFLNDIGIRNGFNFKTVTNDRYPTIPGISKEDFIGKRYFEQYQNLIKIATPEIIKSKVIIVSSVWSNEVPSLIPAFEHFVQSVSSDKKIIILGDFPVVNKNPWRINKSLIRNKNYKYNISIKPLDNRLVKIITTYKNVSYLNLDYSKIATKLPFINDTIAYYDQGHLNLFGAKSLAASLDSEFMYKFKDILNK